MLPKVKIKTLGRGGLDQMCILDRSFWFLLWKVVFRNITWKQEDQLGDCCKNLGRRWLGPSLFLVIVGLDTNKAMSQHERNSKGRKKEVGEINNSCWGKLLLSSFPPQSCFKCVSNLNSLKGPNSKPWNDAARCFQINHIKNGNTSNL